jgi:hypothetical protein
MIWADTVQTSSAAGELCEDFRNKERRAAELHYICACGKPVHGVCTAVNPFAHFSLARIGPIGDNPALSDSGSMRGRQFQ